MSDAIQLKRMEERPKPPQPEEVELRFSKEAAKELELILTHYPNKKAAILPALWIAQREYGGALTDQALQEVAVRLHRSYAEIEGVATFYSMYNVRHLVGKHKIEVCTCICCQVCGGYQILDYLKRKLGIEAGETTSDGVFTLHEVECLNACDRAPLLQVGTEYHGPMDEQKIDALIEDLKKKDESSIVQLADTLVRVHLRNTEYDQIR